MNNLDIRFRKLWNDLSLSGDIAEICRWLNSKYNAPTRHYHNLNHIIHGLDLIDKILEPHENGNESPVEKRNFNAIRLAFWFHDCMPNEQRSADAAEILISVGRQPGIVPIVTQLIELTKHKKQSEYYLGKVMQDADLAILGADKETFDNYETNVRKEYPQYKDYDYAKGRTDILESFLARDKIYGTVYCQRELEDRARDNLKYSIAQLKGML